jgi:hypothetical protein
MKLHKQKMADDYSYNKLNGYGRKGINYCHEDDLREQRKKLYLKVMSKKQHKDELKRELVQIFVTIGFCLFVLLTISFVILGIKS